jgi:hypothetical protein
MTDIPAKEVASKTEFGVVCHLDSVLFCTESENCCQRAKALIESYQQKHSE